MDVKSAFIHENFWVETYLVQLDGFVKDSSLISQLKKSLYSLE